MLTFRANISYSDYIYAFFAGLILVLAFSPFAWRPVAWLSPAIFFWLNLKPMLRGQRMRMAWVYGIGAFAGGVHWIYVSIHYFGGANSLIAGLMVFLFVLLVALTLILFGWLASLFPYQAEWSKLLLVFPAIWGVTEWFRSWFLTGFPWMQLGHTQADTWLSGYVPVIGSLGTSWIVALGSGALVLFLTGKWRERLAALAVVLLTTGGGYMLSMINWTQPVGEALYVSMVQGNIAQQDKWVPELRSAHIQKHLDMTAEHMGNSHLVIWPETAIPDSFEHSMDDVILPLQKILTELDTQMLVGGFHYDASSGKTYNAVMAIGEERQIYGKRHLVPFSEYIPFLEYLRWLDNFVRLPYDNVSKWEGKTNLLLAGQPMRISICYEDAYGEEMTDGLPEATMLVNVTNDGWFTGSIQSQQHVEIARFRSLETGRYSLRSTNNGVTAIIDEKGQFVAKADQYEDVVLAGYAQPMQGSTPYIRWGNWLLIPVLVLTLLVVGWLGRGKFR
ncbi:MAG: apolipoprotein N-acyltransferase [Thiolinea sp.]